MTRQRLLTRAFLLFILATLTACGGGGGGGGGVPTPAPTPTPAKAWGTAVLIETDDAGSASVSGIDFDANGNALAVWQQSDGTRFNLWSNRYTVGQGWGTPVLIETNDVGDVSGSDSAIEANGNALAVWRQFDGTRFNIWSNRYTVGQGWGTAELIETDDTSDASNPRIAIDVNGNALAVWQQSGSIYSNRYTVGQGWGTAALIETDNAGSAFSPQIVIDANGNALAVWQQSDGTRDNIYSNRYTVGQGWGTAELIETDNAGSASRPEIAIDANGNALAVWRQGDGTRDNIWANRFQ